MPKHNNALRPPVGANQAQTIIPTYPDVESMTFTSHPDRQKYIREQRAYGWEVFLSFQGKDKAGCELYNIIRRAL